MVFFAEKASQALFMLQARFFDLLNPFHDMQVF